MPANTTQITDLINRLWARTQAGTLPWEQFGDGSFQSRLGDFVVSISSSNTGSLGGLSPGGQVINLSVKRLDGRVVLHTSTGYSSINALTSALGSRPATIPSDAQKTLTEMYRHLSTRDTDLDELIKQL